MNIPVTDALRALLARDHTVLPPPKSACTLHRVLPILDRPIDCHLCSLDLRETLRSAFHTNEWLDQWRRDVIASVIPS